jgi:SAM-dependent methyltransferase
VHDLEASGLAGRRERALDFGCGAGRLSRALGRYYGEVLGLDIAPSMIELARSLHREHDHCRFAVNERDDLSDLPDASFDLVLTLLVLQHMRPEYALRYVREFVRVLRPGGVLVMQVPSGRRGEARWGRRLARALDRVIPGSRFARRRERRRARRGARPGPHMETYAIPEREIVALLEQLDARAIRTRREPMGRYESVTYFAQK